VPAGGKRAEIASQAALTGNCVLFCFGQAYENIMRAVLMNMPGGPEVLAAAEVPAPVISTPSSVLVKNHAAGINPIDTKVRKRNMYYPEKLPAILGCDGAGVVEATGNAVTRVRQGDEVYFFNNGWATRLVLTLNMS
jgi:NADPH:quinone reductase-like Zn-dependent oxidoreductase